MCGIAGFYNTNNGSSAWANILQAMTDTIRHRGPDSEGQWLDIEAGIALGFRRLAIVDLSVLGNQPMESQSGRYVIIFNGEIYNFLDLRHELETLSEPVHFRSSSDTEVMLAAFEKWGIREALKRFVGMFAFAVWDKQQRQLFLARDRMGEKPLYYGWMGETFLFGSELKALRMHPDWAGELNRDALATYMRHSYVPTPFSIYKAIHKLSPGTLLCLTENHSSGNLPEPESYWSLQAVAEQGQDHPFNGSDEEAIEQLDHLLRDAVRRQMISDVPLGAFLSGGIDSSAIVALMQAQSNRPVQTFSIGFAEQAYNEAPYARAVANHLGTDHTELILSPTDALNVIPLLPTIWDEPFADSSQIPTYLLSRMTRDYVTVSLSGDAGDELFAGYNRYFYLLDKLRDFGRVPAWMQVPLSKIPSQLFSLPAGAFRRIKLNTLS